jgi:ribosomal protein L21
MYAVIETGGKQYRVEVGTELEVELLDVEPGKTIRIDRVLLVADGDDSTIGRPLVDGASVSAEVVNQTRGPKLISFKYRPKARSRVKKGHRQELTVLRVADITVGGKSAAKSAQKAEAAAKTERQRLEEAAVAQAARDAELAAKLAVGTGTAESKPARGKAKAEASAKTEPKPKAEPKAETKTEPKAETGAGVDAAPSKPAETKTATPKRATAKAAPADAPEAEAEAPAKRTRATKKDE